jgi:hypothetical protein
MGKKSGSGSGMNNPDHISESLETICLILQFFDADPGSGMEKIQIRDKHPGSATLQKKKKRKKSAWLTSLNLPKTSDAAQ